MLPRSYIKMRRTKYDLRVPDKKREERQRDAAVCSPRPHPEIAVLAETSKSVGVGTRSNYFCSTSFLSTFMFLFDPRGGLGRALQQCNAGTTLERSEQAPDPLSVAKITNRPRSDTERWKRVLLTLLRVPTPTDLLVSARAAMSG
ncbi:unnamed protein product [Caenorhabditis auriculariae]|uniref:Uncharacterized protein n=1 Tax=Caenorhabditis auriculariae TaxID=2777116 RepID=A0A8S1HNW9_9PELO|nr:unnamed protein product [Caenorhabditis auriculariae]